MQKKSNHTLNLLTIKNIRKQYEKTTVLSNISFSITQGSILGLLGPNGAGKTTLLRILTGIIKPDSGEILFYDESAKKVHFDKIGYLPEERGLYRDMKVEEQLAFLGSLKNIPKPLLKKQINLWLERTELDLYRNFKINQLSKGTQQKIQLIAAILHKPEIVILDEPFSGFDILNIQLAKDLILELHKQGTTFILSAHHLQSIDALCTHMSLINRGKLVLNGSVQSIKNMFRTERYKISGDGTLNHDAQSFEVITAKKHAEHIDAVIVSKGSSNSNQILIELAESMMITSFYEDKPNMEEIFIKSVINTQ